MCGRAERLRIALAAYDESRISHCAWDHAQLASGCRRCSLSMNDQLLAAVDHLRDCGGVDIAASQVSYLFDGYSSAYHHLFDKAGGAGVS